MLSVLLFLAAFRPPAAPSRDVRFEPHVIVGHATHSNKASKP